MAGEGGVGMAMIMLRGGTGRPEVSEGEGGEEGGRAR